MTLDPTVAAAIAAMALATYLTRLAGFWLVRRMTIQGRLAAALEATPGAILVALIAPAALATGPAESGAALATVILARRLPMILAMAGGIACLLLLRAFLT